MDPSPGHIRCQLEPPFVSPRLDSPKIGDVICEQQERQRQCRQYRKDVLTWGLGLEHRFSIIRKKLEKAGTVDFKKHPTRKVRTSSRQCRPKVPGRFAFPGARNPRICSISQFGKNFPAIFPELSRSFPREPPNRPQKQPRPSRVFRN